MNEFLGMFASPHFQLFLLLIALVYALLTIRAPQERATATMSVSLTFLILALICMFVSGWPE